MGVNSTNWPWFAIAAACVCYALACPGKCAAEANVIALRPGMPGLERVEAPPLWADVPDADLGPSDLGLMPPTAYRWVFAPGEPVTLKASCTAAEDRVLLTVWDWERRAVAVREFTGPFAETLRFNVTGRGTYLLTLDRFEGIRCVARLARSFCMCPSNLDKREAWRAGSFQVGVCSFPGRQHWRNDYGPAHPPGLSEKQSREMDADLSARLGATLVRPDLPTFQPRPDAPLDFALADECMSCLTSRGFRLALQLGFPGESDWAVLPRYAGVADPRWRYPRAEQVVRQHAEAVVARYGADAEFVEIYNEPDNPDFWRGTVEEFIATHHWMAEATRRARPDLTIISGGLCLMDPERTGLIARGIMGAVDAVGYHSHGGVGELAATLTAMRALHAAAGYDRPAFYNTETGYANWRLDMERSAAATAVQKLLYCWAHGNRAALLYCSRDVGGPRMSAKDWGAVDFFMCPRFTYGAVAAFMDTYAGARLEGVLRELNGLHVYLFRRGDSRLVSVFVADDFPRPLTLGTDATRAQLLDPMGNAQEVDVAEGRLSLTAGYYPTTVVLEGTVRVQE